MHVVVARSDNDQILGFHPENTKQQCTKISSSMKPPTRGTAPKGAVIIGRDRGPCKFSPGATSCAQLRQQTKHAAATTKANNAGEVADARFRTCAAACQSRQEAPDLVVSAQRSTRSKRPAPNPSTQPHTDPCDAYLAANLSRRLPKPQTGPAPPQTGRSSRAVKPRAVRLGQRSHAPPRSSRAAHNAAATRWIPRRPRQIQAAQAAARCPPNAGDAEPAVARTADEGAFHHRKAPPKPPPTTVPTENKSAHEVAT